MASESPCHNSCAGSPVSGANTTPLGPRRSNRLRQQSNKNDSSTHRSGNHDEVAYGADDNPQVGGLASPTTLHPSVGPNLLNNTVEVTSAFGTDTLQATSIPLAQSAQLHDQVADVLLPSDDVTLSVASHEVPKPLLGKRRQSDAEVAPKKRTKTDSSNIELDEDNEEIHEISHTDNSLSPQESKIADLGRDSHDITQHSHGSRSGSVTEDATPVSITNNAHAVSSVSETTYNSEKDKTENAKGSSDTSRLPSVQNTPSPTGGTAVWPSRNDDDAAFQALVCIEDPKRQKDLVEQDLKRTLNLGRNLIQKVYDQTSATAFNEADGWMKSANHSRASGSSEIGLIAEYPMPVLRADPNPPSQNKRYWLPGPDGLLIMCKMCLGLIVWNDGNAKLMKTFTTKSGTDPDYLRRSGRLQYYAQAIRSPQEDQVRRERGVYDFFKFETFDVEDVNWDIDGPRLMETMSMYEHPHGKPYRIVGALKENGYDEALLCNIWRTNANVAINETHAAFKERRADPDWFRKYRTVPHSTIGDDTMVAEVRVFRILGAAFVLMCYSRVHYRSQAVGQPRLLRGLQLRRALTKATSGLSAVRTLQTWRRRRIYLVCSCRPSRWLIPTYPRGTEDIKRLKSVTLGERSWGKRDHGPWRRFEV